MKNLKPSHFSRSDTVLTATFLSVHMPLSARVSRSDSEPCSRVGESQGRTERGDASPVNPACCQEDAVREELLPRPPQSCRYRSPRGGGGMAQPCWPAARQSARRYAGFSRHIFAPLYRSIFWEEKILKTRDLKFSSWQPCGSQ